MLSLDINEYFIDPVKWKCLLVFPDKAVFM